jgi:hypothetical protein
MKKTWGRFWGLKWFIKWPIVAFVGLVFIGAVAGDEEEDAKTAATSTSLAQQASTQTSTTATTVMTSPSTPGRTVTSVPTPTPEPTPQPVSGQVFIVNSLPVGCHQSPDANSSVAAQRAPGTIQTMDQLIRLRDGVWYHTTADDCWTRADANTTRSFNTSQESERYAASVRPTPPPTPTPPTFRDGTLVVGVDIQPGTYRLRSGSSGCYWARLSGFGGTIGEIIANDNVSGPAVVTIAPTDKGFTSRRCGSWVQDLSPITSGQTAPFRDGTYIVRTDIAPGTWRSEGGSSCYWARLSGFGGTIRDIIANDNTGPSAIVRIGPNDAGFESNRCGTWTKVD